MRLAVPLAIVVLAVAVLAGCGSSGDGGGSTSAPQSSGSSAPAGASAHSCGGQEGPADGLRATGIPCKQAKLLAAAWARNDGCAPADGASRSSCKLEGGYDCLAAVTDRGLAVSCARPGSSVAFTVKS
jgi:hypothetical protein